MKTIVFNGDDEKRNPCVATIGFFDGVHRGHQFLINQVKEYASLKGLESTVITFDRHPRQVMGNEYMPELISTYDEKIARLSLTNIDNCIEKILRDKHDVKTLIIGYEHRFGHNRTDGIDDYVRYGKELGIEVVRSQAFMLNGVNISSSVIRSFFSEGDVEMAAQCLGYPYSLSGTVVKGEHEGRKLGFPTANIRLDSPKMIPAGGAYAVKVRMENTVEMKHAMLNIGVRPTFGDHNTQVIEAHVLRFDGDLYNKKISA